MDDEEREKWARFRFEVISDLLDTTLDRAQRVAVRRAILSRSYVRPDGKTWRVSKRTLSTWLRRYRKGSIAELENRRHKCLGEMRALDEEVLEKAKSLRLALPSRSIEDIRFHLRFTNGIDISKVSASTLGRHLRRVGAVKEKNYAEQGKYQHFQKEHINQLWQTDCSDGIYLPDPSGLKKERQTTLITCIDDASRFCVHGQFFWTEQLVDFLDCFRTALVSRGRPSKLYCDNGPFYRSLDLARICGRLGIGLRHSEKYQPEGKDSISYCTPLVA